MDRRIFPIIDLFELEGSETWQVLDHGYDRLENMCADPAFEVGSEVDRKGVQSADAHSFDALLPYLRLIQQR